VGFGRWFSLAFAPFAVLVAIGPILLAPGGPNKQDLVAVTVTLAMAVILGESMALVGARLRGFQRALIRSEQRTSEALEREREISQRLIVLDDMKNTFLQAVSHELRTPLTAILGNALTLEQSMDTLSEEDARDLARRTAANARKLERLLNDLLDLDRLERGIVLADLRSTDVADLARQAVMECAPLAAGRIRFESESVFLDLDAAKVERIVENLVMNALKYTPAGTPIQVRVLSRDGGALIVVEDEGPGVPDRMKKSVFEPFRRGSQGPNTPGTGIGLTLVARFAELHGGRAWIEDRPGGGASFRVSLPGADSDITDRPERETVPAEGR
jgi:signal transduction histidine kinase